MFSLFSHNVHEAAIGLLSRFNFDIFRHNSREAHGGMKSGKKKKHLAYRKHHSVKKQTLRQQTTSEFMDVWDRNPTRQIKEENKDGQQINVPKISEPI